MKSLRLLSVLFLAGFLAAAFVHAAEEKPKADAKDCCKDDTCKDCADKKDKAKDESCCDDEKKPEAKDGKAAAKPADKK